MSGVFLGWTTLTIEWPVRLFNYADAACPWSEYVSSSRLVCGIRVV